MRVRLAEITSSKAQKLIGPGGASGPESYDVLRDPVCRGRDNRRLVSRAERVSIPAGWKLVRESVGPERFMCIITNPCPGLFRWETGGEVTHRQVSAVIADVRFEMRADKPYYRPSGVMGNCPICTSSGRGRELGYSFTISSAGTEEPQGVVMRVGMTKVPSCSCS